LSCSEQPGKPFSRNCKIDLAIRWHTEVGSSVHATPLITDLYSDGHKDVIVPGFRHGLHLVDGRTGGIDSEFESFHKASLFASPLMYDMDYDGIPDILLPSYSGRVQVYKDTGAEAIYGFTIPRLRVKRDWYEGIDLDPNDHSNPDVKVVDGDESGVGERSEGNTQSNDNQRQARRLMQVGDGDDEGQEGARKEESIVKQQNKMTGQASETFKELFGDEDAQDEKSRSNGGKWLDEDDVEIGGDDYNYLEKSDDEKQETDGDQDAGELTDDYDLDYHDYKLKSDLWEDDLHSVGGHSSEEYKSPHVWIDPHIETTPTIGDIDGDNKDELVLAVSYFFDQSEYGSDSSLAKLAVGENGDINKYLASGVVVYDLLTRSIKWSQHLDLSTSYTRYKAAALSPPTLADINGDGKLEVIIGTSMGFLYVLDADNGKALDGWPIQMGDIQGHVAAADIDQDGRLEIIATDTRGSIAAFRADASEVWEKHVGSAFTAGATLGDVDGDGQLEAVFGTNDGRVYVVDAATGITKKGFPFRTFGKITAPILITKVDSTDSNPGMQIVLTSHDGYLYAIDIENHCARSLDLGEASDAMVLADDLASTGTLDLLAVTSGGNMYSIRTTSKYQPLKSWTSINPGVGEGAYTARWNWAGVYAVAGTRTPRDVRGTQVQIRFTILDKRGRTMSDGSKNIRKPSYKVSATLVGVGVKEMNSGEQPVIGLSQVLNATGTYMMDLPCPKSRTTATIRLEMKDDTGSVYFDEFALSFHIHFYRLLKWLVVGPMCLMAAAVLAFLSGKSHMVQLPS